MKCYWVWLEHSWPLHYFRCVCAQSPSPNVRVVFGGSGCVGSVWQDGEWNVQDNLCPVIEPKNDIDIISLITSRSYNYSSLPNSTPYGIIRTGVGNPSLGFLFSPRFFFFATLGYYSALGFTFLPPRLLFGLGFPLLSTFATIPSFKVLHP